jgi:hypothetical protein
MTASGWWGVNMASDSAPPLPGAGRDQQMATPEDEADATLWKDEFRKFVHGRERTCKARRSPG